MEERYIVAIQAALDAGSAIVEIYHSDYLIEKKKDESPLTTADKESHRIIEKHLRSSGNPILSEEGKTIDYETRKNWDQYWIVDPLDGTKEFIKKNGEFTVNIAWIDNKKPQFGVIYAPIPDILYYGIVGKGAFKIEQARLKFSNYKENDINQFSLPLPVPNERKALSVVASRSHGSDETERFIKSIKTKKSQVELVSRGSSLKLCMIAEGIADIYPRFGLTSEWDVAAGHAIINAAGGKVLNAVDPQQELSYNKKDILNPYFIAISDKNLQSYVDEFLNHLK